MFALADVVDHFTSILCLVMATLLAGEVVRTSVWFDFHAFFNVFCKLGMIYYKYTLSRKHFQANKNVPFSTPIQRQVTPKQLKHGQFVLWVHGASDSRGSLGSGLQHSTLRR